MVLAELISMICTAIEGFFLGLDSVYIEPQTYTMLDIFVALYFFQVVVSFIRDIRRPN